MPVHDSPLVQFVSRWHVALPLLSCFEVLTDE